MGMSGGLTSILYFPIFLPDGPTSRSFPVYPDESEHHGQKEKGDDRTRKHEIKMPFRLRLVAQARR
jgi:hypothetical protein